MIKRRDFIKKGASLGAISVLPFSTGAHANARPVHSFKSKSGTVKIHPIRHASIVLETPKGVIYVDPVGRDDTYAAFAKPDIILATHHHVDHFSAQTAASVLKGNTIMVSTPWMKFVSDDLVGDRGILLANGETTDIGDVRIEAIPAYNITPGRTQYHPKGRDNGYVINVDGLRIYVSGDTEDIAEMRALKNIDIAFVCMNLPFTMDIDQAVSAVAAFRPKIVFPYHYRGNGDWRDNPKLFAAKLSTKTETKLTDWYA